MGAARSGQALHPAAIVAGWMETLPPDQAAFSSGPTPFLRLAITCDLTGRCRTVRAPRTDDWPNSVGSRRWEKPGSLPGNFDSRAVPGT